MTQPLASRIRPVSLAEFVGQEHLAGVGKPLRLAIEKKELFSFVLWGPPGSGKTTLARIYANAVGAEFYELSAVDSGKDDVKRVIGVRDHTYFSAEKLRDPASAPSASGLATGPRPRLTLLKQKAKILFIDEIHRFNRAQQDFLLPFVERGDITLVGATTENPSFEVIAPLLSRCRVFVLNELTDVEMEIIIDRAYMQIREAKRSPAPKRPLKEGSFGAGEKIIARTKLKLAKEARDWLIRMVGGDARQAISVLETADNLYGKITVDSLKEAVQSKHLRYDKKGEEHYNTISAFIKSMRAGQADAAIYYLARMVDAGEDPKFIARRMVVFASEDIGLAQPTALVVANAVFDAVIKIGYPEATINLAHGVAYLTQCKKDRRAYDAVFAALDDVKAFGNLPIPMNIRNAPTKLMKNLGYHKGYKMYPSTKLGASDQESYLPDMLKKKKYLQQ